MTLHPSRQQHMLIGLFTGLCLSWPVSALQPMTEADMSAFTGRDGASIHITNPGAITADQWKWVTDGNPNPAHGGDCTGGAANRHACTLMEDLTLSGLDLRFDIDVGADGGGHPYLSLSSQWSAQQFTLGKLTFNTPALNASGRSLGQMALVSEGSLRWANRGGLFNSGGDYAHFAMNSHSDLIYRQGGPGSPELSLGNLVFNVVGSQGAASNHAPGPGRIGIDNGGLYVSSPFADVEYTFDLAFKESPTDFDTTGRSHLIRFGWQGGLVNATQRIGGGGFGYGTYMDGPNTFQDFDGRGSTPRSQGINLTSSWDFDSDFALVIGEAGGHRSYVRFSDWQRFGNTSGPMFSFPLIFDVVQGGQGPQGICVGNVSTGLLNQSSCGAVGGEWVASNPPGTGDAAFAVLLRDAHLGAYSSQVQVIDPQVGSTVLPIQWGVSFVYGKLDADLFLRPQAGGGLTTDITLVAQSPDAWRRANSKDPTVRATAGDGWRNNVHFLLTDTASPLGSGHSGVGFVNGDIIYRARQLRLDVTDGDPAFPALPGGLWLRSNDLTQYRFRGLFGGGDLADLSYNALTKTSLVDINLQTSQFIFTLNPLPVDGNTGAAPIGFNGLLDFDGNAYMTFAEISSPQSMFFVNNVRGRVGWRNGSLSLVSGQNTPDGLPQLAIRNDLDFGTSAHFGGASGQPLTGTLGYGTEDFGSMAIPAGTWNSEFIMVIPD